MQLGHTEGRTEGRTEIGIRYTRLWIYVELFWNSLDKAPSIYLNLEMKEEVEVGVHDNRWPDLKRDSNIKGGPL